jgi:hypothetical protein
MLYQNISLALVFILATFPDPALAEGKEPQFSVAENGEIILEDLIVYAERLSEGESPIADEKLRPASGAWAAVKEALEKQNSAPMSIEIEFAPGSVVMTADGREKLDFIASALRRVRDGMVFEIHPGAVSETERRRRASLGLDRAYEVIAHLKLNRKIEHDLVVPSTKSPFAHKPRPASKATNTQKFYFVNRGL